MQVDKKFMGRIMLAPNKVQPADGTLLYINFGWNTEGNQSYPEYLPALAPTVSKEDYNALMTQIKEYLDANGISMCLVTTGMVLAPCVIGCFFCGMAAMKANQITADLKAKVAAAPGWSPVARLELSQVSTPQGNTPEFMAFDQYGSPVMGNFGGGKNRSSYPAPAWPPLGYNIVVTVPDPNLNSSWPKNGAAGGAMADPNAIGVAAAAPVVVSATYVAPKPGVMQRGLSGSGMTMSKNAGGVALPATQLDPSETLTKLKNLLDDGLIDQGEYEKKKGEVLARI